MRLKKCVVVGCNERVREGLVRPDHDKGVDGSDKADGRRCWRCRRKQRPLKRTRATLAVLVLVLVGCRQRLPEPSADGGVLMVGADLSIGQLPVPEYTEHEVTWASSSGFCNPETARMLVDHHTPSRGWLLCESNFSCGDRGRISYEVRDAGGHWRRGFIICDRRDGGR